MANGLYLLVVHMVEGITLLLVLLFSLFIAGKTLDELAIYGSRAINAGHS
jgi:hypothetical protein